MRHVIPPDSGHQPSPAEAAWEAHYERIYPEAVFSPEYMAGAYRPAFIAGKKAGFHCGWEEATEAAAESSDQRIRELQQALSDHALGVESGGGKRAHEDRCPLCIQCGGYGTLGTDDLASIAHKSDCRVDRLLRGLIEADPDVAETAWAIIDHHRHG